MVCYSHLFKNFPQFAVIHTVKGFGVLNKAEAQQSDSIININTFFSLFFWNSLLFVCFLHLCAAEMDTTL